MDNRTLIDMIILFCFVGFPVIVLISACCYGIIYSIKEKKQKTKKLSIEQIENLIIKILNSPHLKKIDFIEKNNCLVLEQRYEDISVNWTFDYCEIICYAKVAFKNEFSVFVKPTSFFKYKNFKKKLCKNIQTARLNTIFNQPIDYLAGNILDITPELLKFYLTTEIEEDNNIIDNIIGFKIS